MATSDTSASSVDQAPVGSGLPAPEQQSNLRGAWYALGVLAIVTFLSQLDRNLTSLIVSPLKSEFSMSDTEFGLLHGYGFAITYALFGIPFGRLVDRANRIKIILVGLLFWSVMTALSGFATSYGQLFVLRIGVGIGEAVLAPAAFSLLVDYFEPNKRGRAIGIYYMAMAVGGGGSLFLGALLLGLLPASGLMAPWGAMLDPWRLLFLTAGLPGILACLLILTLREPERRGAVKGAVISIREVIDYMWKHKALLGKICFASTLISTIGYSVSPWMPALMERQFGLSPASTGVPLGVALIVGSIIGTLISGSISDRLTMRGVPDARTRPMVLGYLLMLPACVIGLVDNAWLAMLLFTLVPLSVAVVQCAMPVAFQEAVPPNMRGQIIALQLLIQGLFAIGLGPVLTGLVNDTFFASGDSLAWPIFVLVLPLSLLGLAFCAFSLNARAYARRP